MKNLSLIAMLLLTIVFTAAPSEAGKGSAVLTQLAHIKLLADLSQDLEDATVLIQPNKRDDSLSCVCGCRCDTPEQGLWSCTTTECGMQNQKCESRDWDEAEKDLQSNTQLKAFSMVENEEGN